MFDFDDFPNPEQVEHEFRQRAWDVTAAREWLADLDIDAGAIPGNVAVADWHVHWDIDADRYNFLIYGPNFIGPTFRPALAVPIIEQNKFVDLLLIDIENLTFQVACGRARWLGYDELGQESTIRLHAHPIDWLAAGCKGVCHLEPYSRAALQELQAADEIICNDVHAALEAWDWGFSSDDDALCRFTIDASPEDIRSHFQTQARWRAAVELCEQERAS